MVIGYVEKRSIVRELGEEELLLPGLVNSALAANDRIKYYFTLLQTAREKAENPHMEFPSLRIAVDLEKERLISPMKL
jgi:hypothetical protein